MMNNMCYKDKLKGLQQGYIQHVVQQYKKNNGKRIKVNNNSKPTR